MDACPYLCPDDRFFAKLRVEEFYSDQTDDSVGGSVATTGAGIQQEWMRHGFTAERAAQVRAGFRDALYPEDVWTEHLRPEARMYVDEGFRFQSEFCEMMETALCKAKEIEGKWVESFPNCPKT